MPYDGLVIKSQINYFNENILNENISKIIEPDNKTLQFCFRKNNNDFYLTISISPNFPYISLTDKKLSADEKPQAFCMLLRKYINAGKLINIKQINGKNSLDSLERIIDISIKSISPIGEISIYHLIIELMGRYSNIFFTDNNYIIKDIFLKSTNNNRNLVISKEYNTNFLTKKNELLNISFDSFFEVIKNTYKNQENKNIINCFINSFYGISKIFIINILNDLNIEENELIENLKTNNKNLFLKIFNQIFYYIKLLNENLTTNYIYYENEKIKDFYIFKLDIFENYIKFNNINDCINKYINDKYNITSNSVEKKSIENITLNLIKKTTAKIHLLENEIELAKDYELYKDYGDLLLTFGYDIKNIKNDTLICENYNENNKKTLIPIDTNLSIQENSQKYYNLYNKKKRTIEKSTELLNKYTNDLEQLKSILDNLTYNTERTDLSIIKFELNKYFNEKIKNIDFKRIKKTNYNIKHFLSSSNIDIYVGKNNLQNEYVTFEIAKPNDTWFHVKNSTGSHVILKAQFDKVDIKTIEEAASLAAFYSSLKNESKVTVDYTLKKEIKKVKNRPIGFVIYKKNFSINVKPNNNLKEIH